MEIKLTEEQISEINAILNSFPISQLDRVQAIIKVFQDAQGAEGGEGESVTRQLSATEDANTED